MCRRLTTQEVTLKELQTVLSSLTNKHTCTTWTLMDWWKWGCQAWRSLPLWTRHMHRGAVISGSEATYSKSFSSIHITTRLLPVASLASHRTQLLRTTRDLRSVSAWKKTSFICWRTKSILIIKLFRYSWTRKTRNKHLSSSEATIQKDSKIQTTLNWWQLWQMIHGRFKDKVLRWHLMDRAKKEPTTIDS